MISLFSDIMPKTTESLLAAATWLLFTATLLAPVNSDELDDAMTNDLATTFEKQQKQCYDYFKSTMQEVVLMMMGQMGSGKSRDQTFKSQTMCWVTCLLTKAGILNMTDGSIQNDKMVEKMSQLPDSNKEELTASGEMCKIEAARGYSGCERGYIYVQCLYNEMRKKKGKNAEKTPRDWENPEKPVMDA